MSGDSFGQNPLNRSSSGNNGTKEKKQVPDRDKIAEDFLENDEDEWAESGEINPEMF